MITVDGLILPDLRAIVEAALERGVGLTLDHDPAAIGRLILRQATEQKGGERKLRLSGAGACPRQLAHIRHGTPGEALRSASGRLTFAVGDATEALLAVVVREALQGHPGLSIRSVGTDQRTVEVVVQVGERPWDTIRIPGHPDGVGECEVEEAPAFDLVEAAKQARLFDEVMFNGGYSAVDAALSAPTTTRRTFVWEVKSMADYGFKHFREKGLGRDDSYWWQAQAYQLALRQAGHNVVGSYLIAYGKQVTTRDAVVYPDGTWDWAPALHGQWILCDDDAQREIAAKFREVWLSSRPEDVPIPTNIGPQTWAGRDGKQRGKLGFPCEWCQFLKVCWPTAMERVEKSAYGTKVHAYVPPPPSDDTPPY